MAPEAKIALAELRSQLGDTVDRATFAGQRTVITRNGKRAAAIVTVDDFELLEKMEQEVDLELLRKARIEDNGERTRLEDLLRELADEE